MSNENELSVPASAADVAALIESSGEGKYADEQAMASVMKSGDYLPYIALNNSTSKLVVSKKVEVGNFTLHESKNTFIDLGDEVVMFIFAYRPKAMQYSPETIAYFDPNTEEFKEIKARSGKKNSQCGYGPEFMVWLPDQKKLAAYFMGNKTARNESPNLVALTKPNGDEGPKRQCIQKSEIIDDGQNIWYGATTKPYDLEIQLPPMDLVTKELEKFNNPPQASRQAAEKDEEDGGGRD